MTIHDVAPLLTAVSHDDILTAPAGHALRLTGGMNIAVFIAPVVGKFFTAVRVFRARLAVCNHIVFALIIVADIVRAGVVIVAVSVNDTFRIRRFFT